MKKMKQLTLTAILIIFLLQTSLFAQMMRRNRMDAPPSRGNFCFGSENLIRNQLHLSEQQRKKVEKINLFYRKNFFKLKEKLFPLRDQLQYLILEEKPNLTAIKQTLNKIATIEANIEFSKIKHYLKIKQFLSKKK